MNNAEQVLRSYQLAMLTGDAESFASLYHPDGVHEFPFANSSGLTRLEGRAEIHRFYRRAWDASPVEIAGVDVTALHLPADPDTAIAEMNIDGVVRATGAAFSLNTVVVIITREGLIAVARDYMDVFGLARQTGNLRALTQPAAVDPRGH